MAMLERQKVIKGLEALRHAMSEHQCYVCSHEFIDAADEFGTNIIDDAIALLKEQEAQLVLSNRVCETEPFIYVRKGFCPKCHQVVEWYLNRAYCGFCGQAVKWDESD